MATPPTRVTYVTPAVGYGSTTTPKTTPTFDVTNGDLLTVIGSSENESVTLNTPTATGGSVTWTLRQSIVVTDYCSMYVWTGAVGATATGITVSVARATGSSQWSFGVTVWRNHGGVGTSAKTNVSSGAPSLAISCSDNSALVVGCDDWNAVDGTSRTWRTVNGSAITESLYFRNSATYTVYSGYRTDTGAAGSQTVGLSAPTGQKYSIAAVEVLGTAGGPDPKTGSDTASSTEGTTSITGTASRTDAAATTEGSTGLAAASTVTDSAALSEAVSLARSLTASDLGAVSESAALTQSLAATDALILTDSASLAAALTVSDTGSLADSGALTGSQSVSDTGSLAESASIAASASGSDSGTLGESADADGGTTEYRFPSGAGLTPTGTHDDTPSTLNLGTVFTLTAASDIDGVALYATAATTFTAQLWANGTKVAEKTGISHAGTGWVDGLFDTSYSGTTGVDYIVSALQDTGTTKYSSRTLTFSDGTNPVLVEVGPVRSNTTNNGLYTYGTGIPATPSGTNGMWFGVDAIVAGAVSSGPDPVTDTVTLSDTAALAVALAVADDGTLTETTGQSVTASDSATITETVALVAAPAAADGGSLADTSSLNTGSNQSAADTGTLVDAQSLAAALSRTDTGALTDTALVSVPKTGSDTAALSEMTDTLITDTDPDGTLSETLTLSAALSIADAAALSETANVSASGNPSATDTANLTDTATVTGVYVATDSASLSESAAIVVVIARTDSAVSTETATLSATLTRADSGTITDGASVSVSGVNVSTSDAGTLNEAATVFVAVAASDAGSVGELVTVGALMARADDATLTDVGTWADTTITDYNIRVGRTSLAGPNRSGSAVIGGVRRTGRGTW